MGGLFFVFSGLSSSSTMTLGSCFMGDGVKFSMSFEPACIADAYLASWRGFKSRIAVWVVRDGVFKIEAVVYPLNLRSPKPPKLEWVPKGSCDCFLLLKLLPEMPVGRSFVMLPENHWTNILTSSFSFFKIFKALAFSSLVWLWPSCCMGLA